MNRNNRHKPRWQAAVVGVALAFFATCVCGAALSTPTEAARQPVTTITPVTPPPTEYITLQATTEPAPPQGTESPSLIWSLDFGEEDYEILAKIAMAEAEGETTEGKALVILVVLNRVWSDGFPDTIEGVVFQKLNGYYQFSPVEEGGRYWTTEPDTDCYKALDLVMDGWDESRGALYFEAASITSSWQSRNCNFLFQYGGHNFYN